MPFTPYHLGPALGFSLPLRKHVHMPTFLLANIVIDIEPLLVLVCSLRYPLHGYFHTFLLASLLGIVVGCVMFRLKKFLHPIYMVFLPDPGDKFGLKRFTLTGAFGAVFHVLLDSPLYGDIQPFYPLEINPLYAPDLSPVVYDFCTWIGALGILYYVFLLACNKIKHRSSG